MPNTSKLFCPKERCDVVEKRLHRASVVRVLDHCFFSSSFCAINYRLLLPCVWFISRTGNKNWPVSQHLVMPSNANQIKIEHNVFPAFVIKMPDGRLRIQLVLVQFQKYRQSIMVFCYQNCSDLLREKNYPVIEKSFWDSRLKAEDLQIFWDH